MTDLVVAGSSDAGPTIDLAVPGPNEAEWARLLAELAPFRWPDIDRLVVVSPHPDDETLGVGGLIATAAIDGRPVLVVSVTDGDAASSRPGLGSRRRAELASALGQLGDEVDQHRLGLPDGTVAAQADRLADLLAVLVGARDLVVSPLPDDGHPDHAATARATTAAARQVGAEVRWFPVWAWHCHDPARSPIGRGRRLDLAAAARRRKQAAIACYRSQLAGADPVVPPRMVARLDRSCEVLIAPPDHPDEPGFHRSRCPQPGAEPDAR